MEYTKGEWKYEEELLANMSMISCDNKVIAGIPNDVSEDKGAYLEQVANATLIASAPNLYEALKDLLALVVDAIEEPYQKDKEICEKARQALARAEGKDG